MKFKSVFFENETYYRTQKGVKIASSHKWVARCQKINMRSFAHKVAFVTSNIYKVKEIQHLLDHSALRGKFHLTPLNLKTLEIQEDNSVKITRAKLLNAVQQLRVCGKEGAKQFQWVMVEDTSLCINALGGSFHFLLEFIMKNQDGVK